MSVRTTTFGSVRLTKQEARKFRQQVTYGRPKQAAVDAYARGKEAANSYVSKGYAILTRG